MCSLGVWAALCLLLSRRVVSRCPALLVLFLADKKGDTKAPPQSAAPLAVRDTVTDVLVCTVGDSPELMTKRLKLVRSLWDREVAAEIIYKTKLHPKKQLDFAAERQIPLVVMVGDDELGKKTVKLRRVIAAGQEQQGSDRAELEHEVPEDTMVDAVIEMIAKTGTSDEQRFRAVIGSAGLEIRTGVSSTKGGKKENVVSNGVCEGAAQGGSQPCLHGVRTGINWDAVKPS
jgi:hypothetical protein